MVWGTIADATLGVDVFRARQSSIQVLLDDFPQSGSQFNLVGYSYGSLAAAQVAVNYAQGGTSIDNLVLVGSPIDAKYLAQIRAEPNIKKVITIDLTAQGDPIYAGMSRGELLIGAPEVAAQMMDSSGHFYYAPSTAEGQARRDALAASLYQRGLR